MTRQVAEHGLLLLTPLVPLNSRDEYPREERWKFSRRLFLSLWITGRCLNFGMVWSDVWDFRTLRRTCVSQEIAVFTGLEIIDPTSKVPHDAISRFPSCRAELHRLDESESFEQHNTEGVQFGRRWGGQSDRVFKINRTVSLRCYLNLRYLRYLTHWLECSLRANI